MKTNEPSVIITYFQVQRALRGLKEFEQEKALLPESLDGNLERLARIYAMVEPLLELLAGLPLMPPLFRKAIAFLSAGIEAVLPGNGNISARFKAGRDL